MKRRRLAPALFLAPNIAGFLAFVLIPLGISLAMAFTDWDLRRHNMFKEASPRFVGLEQFQTFLTDASAPSYFINTLVLMLGIPFAIGGSLLAALALSRELRGGPGQRLARHLLAAACLTAGLLFLLALGLGASGLGLLITGLFGAVLIAGNLGGKGVYRTLFYTPHFTAGVATFLLWKRLYSPAEGPINRALSPILDQLATLTRAAPPWLFEQLAPALCAAAIAAVAAISLRRARLLWRDGDLSAPAAVLGLLILSGPLLILALTWPAPWRWLTLLGCAVALIWQGRRALKEGRSFTAPIDEGLGTALMLASGLAVVLMLLVILGLAASDLPTKVAADALGPPEWLQDYDWAKPALIIMGLWAAIGSNNMLLYLAALSNIPRPLYDAAAIDGAGALQRFWHVTWPQLAPTTFFITVMSLIYGLQGGFEMARTMTNGGPAGATTTLSYHIYIEGFQIGRLGYASAAAWALFLLIGLVTLVAWRLGKRYGVGAS